jgi:hypothetical protein
MASTSSSSSTQPSPIPKKIAADLAARQTVSDKVRAFHAAVVAAAALEIGFSRILLFVLGVCVLVCAPACAGLTLAAAAPAPWWCRWSSVSL